MANPPTRKIAEAGPVHGEEEIAAVVEVLPGLQRADEQPIDEAVDPLQESAVADDEESAFHN